MKKKAKQRLTADRIATRHINNLVRDSNRFDFLLRTLLVLYFCLLKTRDHVGLP
jgi:hypothetical protein